MKSISIVINARLQSSRLPNKMILPFSKTTLINIALEKINNLMFFQHRFLAIYDDQLRKEGKKYKNIEIINRDYNEVRKGIVKLEDRFLYFQSIPTDYIFLLNPCCPLTSFDTIKKAFDYFQETNYESYTSVIETRDWIFELDSNCITRKDYTNVATNKGDVFYKATHMFHIVNRKRFLKDKILWTFTKNDPHCISISEDEYVDIDNYREFKIAEYLYENRLEF